MKTVKSITTPVFFLALVETRNGYVIEEQDMSSRSTQDLKQALFWFENRLEMLSETCGRETQMMSQKVTLSDFDGMFLDRVLH